MIILHSQVDDWTLLKITEKIIQRNVFKQKKKKPGLSADRPSKNCAQQNIYCASKTKSSFYTPDVSSNNKHLRRTIRYHAAINSLQNLFIMIHSLICHNHRYLSQEPPNCYLYAQQTYRTHSPKLRLLLVLCVKISVRRQQN